MTKNLRPSLMLPTFRSFENKNTRSRLNVVNRLHCAGEITITIQWFWMECRLINPTVNVALTIKQFFVQILVSVGVTGLLIFYVWKGCASKNRRGGLLVNWNPAGIRKARNIKRVLPHRTTHNWSLELVCRGFCCKYLTASSRHLAAISL